MMLPTVRITGFNEMWCECPLAFLETSELHEAWAHVRSFTSTKAWPRASTSEERARWEDVREITIEVYDGQE